MGLIFFSVFTILSAMILLDEQFTGLASFLRSLGWEVLTVLEIGLRSSTDEKVLEYCKLNDCVLVTEDTGLAQLAELHNLKHVWVSQSKIAKLVHAELQKMKKN